MNKIGIRGEVGIWILSGVVDSFIVNMINWFNYCWVNILQFICFRKVKIIFCIFLGLVFIVNFVVDGKFDVWV